MRPTARLRYLAIATAVICCLVILYAWVDRTGFSHPALMLVPFAPFLILGVTAFRTKSATTARASLALLLCFGAFLAFRLVYPHLRNIEDEWLLMSLLVIGAWEIMIASAAILILFAVQQPGTKWPGGR